MQIKFTEYIYNMVFQIFYLLDVYFFIKTVAVTVYCASTFSNGVFAVMVELVHFLCLID